MKLFLILTGCMSLIAGAAVTTAPVDDGAVQVNYGLIKSFDYRESRNMCLAARKKCGAKMSQTQIQLQVCNKTDTTQIWKFHPSENAIHLASPPGNKSVTQCLTAIPEPDPEQVQPRHYLSVAPCNSTNPEQQFNTTISNGIKISSGALKDHCIDIPHYNYTAGTRVVMYNCKVPSELNQQWITVSA
ncbi:hypothetical protein BGZ68_009287 [Mortierella alpina]|nr:hypothetical protein BGZ68_009287 [Mortierella alpina]